MGLRRLSIVLFLGSALGLGDFYDETFEAEDHGGLVEEGENTCIVEAIAREPTSLCPFVETGYPYPPLGIRILDSFYSLHPSNVNPTYSRVGPTPSLAVNLRRTSAGALPDLLLPGGGTFSAFFGFWYDLSGEGRIDPKWEISRTPPLPLPSNEWVAREGTVVSFVMPGSHPPFWEYGRPEEDVPDFRYALLYRPHGIYTLRSDHTGLNALNLLSFVIFVDGSLLQDVDVTTVTDPLLVPSERFPFTPRWDSLVDIDPYASIAPAPLSTIYGGTLAPFVHEMGSPNLAWCPTRECSYGWPKPSEEIPPFRSVSRTVGEGNTLYDSVVGSLWYEYPREYLLNSSSNLPHSVYLDSWNGWIDLIPEFWIPSFLNYNLVYPVTIFNPLNREGNRLPLLRGGVGGDPWMPPGGSLAVEVFVGAWRDLDGDGFVGRVGGEDPYFSGSRPLPDDYVLSHGEFLPARAPYLQRFDFVLGCVPITILPDTTFEDLGRPTLGPLGSQLTPWQGKACGSTNRRDSGVYLTTAQSFDVPLGTLRSGFTVCAGPVDVEVPNFPPSGDSVIFKGLWDCDHVSPPGG